MLVMSHEVAILLVSDRNLAHVSHALSQEMTSCYHWLVDNKLAMHKGKTEALVISSKRKHQSTQGFTIKLDEHKITPTDKVKYLGLTINATLSGEEIVASIFSKSMARLKFLYRHRDVLDTKARYTMSKALLLPHFDYAISAWYLSINKKCKKQLQVSQNKIVRFMLNLGPRVHIGQTELDRAGLLSVSDRAKQIMLHHMFDIFHGTAPDYLVGPKRF
jgi:hypothetical protein